MLCEQHKRVRIELTRLRGCFARVCEKIKRQKKNRSGIFSGAMRRQKRDDDDDDDDDFNTHGRVRRAIKGCRGCSGGTERSAEYIHTHTYIHTYIIYYNERRWGPYLRRRSFVRSFIRSFSPTRDARNDVKIILRGTARAFTCVRLRTRERTRDAAD